MKFCDISALYYPHGGGIKTYIDNKRIIYKQRNIANVLLAPNVKDLNKVEVIKDGSLTLYYLPCRKISFTGTSYYIFKNFADIAKVLEAEKPDIVEIGDKATTLFFAKKIQALHSSLDLKIFAFSHERADNFTSTVVGNKIIGRLLATFVMKRFIAAADYVIANSAFTAGELKTIAKPEKVFVIYLGINAANLVRANYFNQALYDQLSDHGKKFLLVHVGRLDKDKKIGLLVDIAHQLDPARYTLVVVGGGGYQQLIKNLSVVEFVGYRPYEEVKQYLSVCDLGILINDIEPYGLVGLEMMAMGLPVLGPDRGGLPSFLRPAFAWLLPHRADAYLTALKQWSTLSPDQKNQMSAAARTEAEKYSLDAMVDQLLKIYTTS